MQNIKDQLNNIVKLFNKGEKQIALNKISLLIPNDEKNIELLLLHAKICINLNEISKANFSLEKILKLDLNNIEALKLIYINYLKSNKMSLFFLLEGNKRFISSSAFCLSPLLNSFTMVFN